MTTTTLLWLKSYRNHCINCSVYLAIVIICFQSSQNQMAIHGYYHMSVLLFLYQIITVIVSMLLRSELNYIFLRSTLPPGDSGWPIFGDLFKLVQLGPRDLFLDRTKQYGSPSTQNMFMTPVIVVSKDDDVNQWIAHERKGDTVPSIIPHLKALLGHDTIMMQSSKQHRRLRRMLEPSFSPIAVKEYLKIVDSITTKHLEEWASEEGEYFNSQEWSFLAMRLFFGCAFGEVDETLLKTLNRLFESWIKGAFAIIPYRIPGTALYKAHAAKEELAAVLQGMVDNFKAQNPPGSPVAEASMMGRLCYGLDEQGQPLADSQLISNIQFILFAGHDTTKGSFSAFVHYLNKFPKVRAMLIDEVQTFSEPLDFDELKNAPLLNAFLAETWRLASPLGDHVLEAAKDIEFNGYKVRKGVRVVISIQGHNVLKYQGDGCEGNNGGVVSGRYRDASEFRIERWLPENHQLHDPKYFQEGVNYNLMSHKYRTFNMGAHSCLGSHFAKLEARVVLTRLLQSYDIHVRNESLKTFPLLQHENEFMLTKRIKK